MDNLDLVDMIRIALLIAIGIPLVFLLARVVSRATRKKLSEHVRALVRKLIIYGGIVFLLVTVLGQAGFDLTVLLGAAGVVGLAIGFASQTSVSNIISGIFLISEKPFAVGDVIQVGQTMGIVLSIDLLSVKVRTFDNRYVRMPNETLIKSELINITRFPIRRFDLTIGVAYKEDIVRVMKILADVIDKNPYCLDEPEPLILSRNSELPLLISSLACGLPVRNTSTCFGRSLLKLRSVSTPKTLKSRSRTSAFTAARLPIRFPCGL